VALLLSLFVAMAAITAGAGWKIFLAVFGSACVTHFGSFIKDHPVDKITFDSQTDVFTRTGTEPPPTDQKPQQ